MASFLVDESACNFTQSTTIITNAVQNLRKIRRLQRKSPTNYILLYAVYNGFWCIACIVADPWQLLIFSPVVNLAKLHEPRLYPGIAIYDWPEG